MTQTPPEPLDPSDLQDPDPNELSRRERATLEAENRKLKLENLMLGSGVNPNEGLGKLFFDGYQGELTTEAVKAAAEGYNLIRPEGAALPPGTGEVTDPEVRAQTLERQTAAAGATPEAGGPTEDPRVLAVRAGNEVLDQGGTLESAMGTAFDTIAAAGYGGEGRKPDERAQWVPGKQDDRRPDQGW